jgi:hypothetical protein
MAKSTNGKLFVSDNGNGNLYSTTDGTNWTTAGPVNGINLNGITYTGTAYITAGQGQAPNTGAAAERSTTGVGPWTQLSPGVTYLNGIATNSITTVAAFQTSGLYKTSNDGTSWSLVQSSSGNNTREVVVANDKFFGNFVFAPNGTCAFSADGTTWTDTGIRTGAGVAYTGSLYVSANGADLNTSSNGTTWTNIPSSTTGISAGASLVSIVYLNNTVYLTDYASNNLYFTTTPGGAWQSVTAPWAINSSVYLTILGSSLYGVVSGSSTYYQIF